MENNLNKKLAKAYKKHDGNISESCKEVGVERQYFIQQVKEDAAFKEAVRDVYESIIDMVEGKLIESIKKGNLRAIMFFLKTKGKNRGYTEAIEVKSEELRQRVVMILPDNGRTPKMLKDERNIITEAELTKLTHKPKKKVI